MQSELPKIKKQNEMIEFKNNEKIVKLERQSFNRH